jgi:farnesol dehydrogenase
MQHSSMPPAPLQPGEKAFVTGATGFIGTRLVEKLVQRGVAVRALCRQPRLQPPPGFGHNNGGPLDDPFVERVMGDLDNPDSLRRGMEGCQYVFHLAGYARNWARRAETFFEVNVTGTRNVFSVAQQLGVRRIVWTSGAVTLGPTLPNAVADEETPRSTPRCFNHYERSKCLAEQEAQQWAARGLPVVTVNPTRVFGPGHLTEGNSVTRLIDDYDRGRMPFLLNLGRNVGNWAFVDDVAEGHILAMLNGRVGQRYILGGQNASLREFFEAIDAVSGRRHLKIPLLRLTPLVFAWFLEKRAEWFGVYPRITPGWINMFCHDAAYSCLKAVEELGYRITPLSDALRITYQWLLRVRAERKQ